MLQRVFTLSLCGVFLLLLASPCLAAEESSESKRPPNILLILADDLGYGDVSRLQSQGKIKTPRIDALARSGLVYTDAHSGSSVSGVSRYSLLTGRYGWRAGLAEGESDGFEPLIIGPDRLTIASALTNQNYATGYIGVWGLAGTPTDAGFHFSFGTARSLGDEPQMLLKDGEAIGSTPTENKDVLPATTDFIGSILDQMANQPQTPFFLVFAPPAPGYPPVTTAETEGLSQAGAHGDAVLALDAAVGFVLDRLAKHGLDENTVVVFISDNGSAQRKTVMRDQFGHFPNKDWKGRKTHLWEGGHRVPLFIRYPGETEAGQRCHVPVCLTDLMRTLSEIGGYSIRRSGAAEDSFDIATTFSAPLQDGPVRDVIVHHGGQDAYAVREGDWKLIDARGSGGKGSVGRDSDPPIQLYNLKQDPEERNNVHRDYPDLAHRLYQLIRDLRKADASRTNPDRWIGPQPDLD